MKKIYQSPCTDIVWFHTEPVMLSSSVIVENNDEDIVTTPDDIMSRLLDFDIAPLGL